jgi:hypothetical protein
MNMDFDFKRAWTEVAKPALDALFPTFRDLIYRVQEESEDLGQDKDLNLVWPKTDLRAAFEAIPSKELAEIAHVFHAYSHWAFSYEGRWSQLSGLGWHFSNYADQILRARCRLPRDNKDSGITFQIYEGLLSICYSSSDCWMSRDIGLATEETLARAMKSARIYDCGDFGQNGFDAFAGRVADKLWPKEGHLAGFRNICENHVELAKRPFSSYWKEART